MNMKLQSKYFDYIKNGTKRIELRLYDEKRRKINLGDTITFTDIDTQEKISVKVIGLLRYNSFEDLISDFSNSILVSKDVSKENLLNLLNGIYSLDEQKKYGVLGIRFDII